jgi:hypothetical protein
VATPVSLPIFEPGSVNQRSPAQVKIALFRSLFHGREDVYPQRFESRKTSKAGYSPACGNEWVLETAVAVYHQSQASEALLLGNPAGFGGSTTKRTIAPSVQNWTVSVVDVWYQ